MQRTTPTVSILLPAYNAELYLEEAIESVLNQTFDDFELLLLNDGSTDKTAHIIYQYALRDIRIRPIRNETNLGLIATLNNGLAMAKGIYIARMDADDICRPDRLALQVAYLNSHPSVALVGSQGTYIGAQSGPLNQPLSAEAIRARLYFDNPLIHSSVLMRRGWLEAHDIRYREAALYAEDFDMWVQLVEAGGQIVNLPERLLFYRIHEQSISQAKRQQQEHTAGTIRRRQWAKFGIHFSEELASLMDSFMFQGSFCPDRQTLLQLRHIYSHLKKLPIAGSFLDRNYELGRFMASIFPRAASLKHKVALAQALARIDASMAALFIPQFLKGKP